MTAPARNHKLSLDARAQIDGQFTRKLDNLTNAPSLELDTLFQLIHPDYQPDAETHPGKYTLPGINNDVPVAIDWPMICRVLIERKCFSTSLYVVQSVCKLLGIFFFQLRCRLVLSTAALSTNDWQKRYLAADIRRISVRVVDSADVDVFIRGNIINLEIPTLNSHDLMIIAPKQIRSEFLWDHVFDRDEYEVQAPVVTTSTRSHSHHTLRTPSVSDDDSITVNEAPTLRKPLPTAESLPPPSQFFLQTPPYILTFKLYDHQLLVECNHVPTVKLFDSFFKHTTESNPAPIGNEMFREMNRPLMGDGLILDVIVIAKGPRGERISEFMGLPSFLSFAESVCGYRLVTELCRDGFYYFRRDGEFGV